MVTARKVAHKAVVAPVVDSNDKGGVVKDLAAAAIAPVRCSRLICSIFPELAELFKKSHRIIGTTLDLFSLRPYIAALAAS